MSSSEAKRFETAARSMVAEHPIVRENLYTSWFSAGTISLEDLRDFTVQFSVFSHLFLEAQLRKCINAQTIDSYRAGKEILLNELGVSFGPDGSVDGSRFRFSAAHFEWLLEFGRHLGLEFSDLGKRANASASTLQFCNVLLEVYGSEDPSTASGASFAIEHWAAAGFWKELIAGLRVVKGRRPDLPLGFWTWHDHIEDQHAAHTGDELREAMHAPGFDEGAFLRGGRAVLDAVEVFWMGLARRQILRRVA